MRIRPYEPSDRERVLELRRAHGEEFVFPDPEDSLNPYWLILEDDDGVFLGAVAGRVTLEGFVLVNHQRGTAHERWGWVRSLVEVGNRWAYNMGLGELHFWVHPRLRSFARRMAGIPGCQPDHRHSFTVKLKERYAG